MRCVILMLLLMNFLKCNDNLKLEVCKVLSVTVSDERPSLRIFSCKNRFSFFRKKLEIKKYNEYNYRLVYYNNYVALLKGDQSESVIWESLHRAKISSAVIRSRNGLT